MTTLAAIVLLSAACSSQPTAAEEQSATEGAFVAPSTAADGPPTGETVPISSTGADELRDLLRPGDPAAAYCLADLGVAPGEFYDKDADELVFPEQTYFFEARYDDGTIVEIRIHPDLTGEAVAMTQAERVAAPISLLPTELRQKIERVGFLGGESTAQADGGGEGIHVYERNVTVREQANRFEETLFHESVHTSLDDSVGSSAEWIAAQQADGEFLTEYAASNPQSEDLAETSLYAWALLHFPQRISEADAQAWRAAIPERIAVIGANLSPPGQGYAPMDVSC